MNTATLLWITMKVYWIKCMRLIIIYSVVYCRHTSWAVTQGEPLDLNVVFLTELEKWRSPEFYDREVHRMQLPFSGKVPSGSVSAEERQERRAQQLRRLQEINARRREEKLLQNQEKLDRLMAVQARDSVCLLYPSLNSSSLVAITVFQRHRLHRSWFCF